MNKLFLLVIVFPFFYNMADAQLVINEFMASNSTAYADEFGEFDDWIEIYNAGTEAIDLGGYYLTDDLADVSDYYRIPTSNPSLTTIASGKFLLFWADKSEEQGVLHLDFKLSGHGEQVGLIDPDGITIIDGLTFGSQSTDVSYGRIEDGGAEFAFFPVATPGASNVGQSLPTTFISHLYGQIAATHDDAVEHHTGGMIVENYDITTEKGGVAYKMGLRFPNIAIPSGAVIKEAWVQFTSLQGEDFDPADWQIGGHAVVDAPVFDTIHNNISDRELTSSIIDWAIEPWEIHQFPGLPQRTPNLATIVQEIIDLSGWEQANAIAFIFSGPGQRKAYSYDGIPEFAPRLYIEFEVESPQVPVNSVYINELAPNSSTYADETGDVEDWIEIYNGGSEEVKLGGLFLSDNPNNLLKWQINDLVTLAPGGFLTILADKETEKGGLHADFNLNSDGETLVLSQVIDNEIIILDSISYPPVPLMASFGRTTDGEDAWTIFGEITPLASNDGAGLYLPPPTITPEGGIFEDDVYVHLAHESDDVVIRYTLDGSEPTDSSEIYTGLIELEDYDGGKVVRAKAFKSNYYQSVTEVESYLFDIDHELPVVHITTDPVNLWDDEIGIYVLGTNGIDANCANAEPANYFQDWERPAEIAMYEPDGTQAFSVKAGIKVSGNCSRMFDLKSFNILLRKNKYGDKEINYQLFPERGSTKYRRLRLRNSGQDFSVKMFQDAALQTMLKDHFEYQAYRPVVVYLNAEYWGILNMREQYGFDYLKRNQGLEKGEYDLIKGPGLQNEVKGGDLLAFQKIYHYCEANDLSIADNYSFVQTKIDDENFLNYWIAMVYLSSADWPANNKMVWRDRNNGKFRWYLIDLDATAGIYGDNSRTSFKYNTLEFATDEEYIGWPNDYHSSLIFRKMLENEHFKNEFIQRSCTFMQTTFDENRANDIIDTIVGRMDSEMDAFIIRWKDGLPYLNDKDHWKNSKVKRFRDFFEKRPAHWLGIVKNYFSIDTTFQLTFNYDEETNGDVFLHSYNMKIPYDYSAQYFKGIPIEVKAVAKTGYIFSHWLETGETEPVIFFQASDDATLTPVFMGTSIVQVDLGADINTCLGEQLTLDGTVAGCSDCSYEWNDGYIGSVRVVTPETTRDYSLIVTNGSGATGMDTVTVYVNQLPTVEVELTNVGCHGDNSGQITVIPTGTAPFEYTWNGEISGASLQDVPAGEYTLLLADANGCESDFTVTVEEPEELVLEELDIEQVSCNGNSDGRVEVSATGGIAPYDFEWSNGTNGANLENVPSGTYNVTLTDENNCTATLAVEVVEPEILEIELENIIHVLCNGDSDGHVEVAASGGTTPYTYDWNNDTSEETLVDVAAGAYALTLTDAQNCTAIFEVEITEPESIDINLLSLSAVSCHGDHDGQVAVFVEGGVEPYAYDWSNGSHETSLENLSAGEYSLTITDENDCISLFNVMMEEPEELEVEITSMSGVSCFGESDGLVIVAASGGNGDYEYEWSNGIVGNVLPNVSAGDYSLEVIDGLECEFSYNVTVASPELLRANVIVGNPTTAEGNGSITITSLGGTPPVEILWENGETSFIRSGLGGGVYPFELLDANGCQYTDTIILDSVVAIDEIPNISNLILYPNPNSGYFEVKWETIENGWALFTVYNVLGQKIKQNEVTLSAKEIVIDISVVSSGIYFLEIQTKNGRLQRKFRVE